MVYQLVLFSLLTLMYRQDLIHHVQLQLSNTHFRDKPHVVMCQEVRTGKLSCGAPRVNSKELRICYLSLSESLRNELPRFSSHSNMTVR